MGVIGSLAELTELTVRDLSGLDPHRPFIDEVTFTRPGEEGTYRRGAPGIHAWYDPGGMPLAPGGGPHRHRGGVGAGHPAQVIFEANDPKRGRVFFPLAGGAPVF